MFRYRLFDYIMALFVTVLVLSNIASSAKIVDWGFSLLRRAHWLSTPEPSSSRSATSSAIS